MKTFWTAISVFLIGCGVGGPIHNQEYYDQLQSEQLQLDAVNGDAQSGIVGETLVEPLVVRAVDNNEKPLSDKEVTFEVTDGEATVLGEAKVRTDSEGMASVRIRLGRKAAAVRVVARLNAPVFDETRHQVTFQATCLPPLGPVLLVLDDKANGQRGAVTTNLPIPLGVLALGENGLPVSGQEILYSVTKGSPDVRIVPVVTTDVDGTASAVLSLGTRAEDIEVTATWDLPDPAADPAVVFRVTAEAGPPSSLKFVSGHVNGTEEACVAETKTFEVPVVLRLTDAYLNPIYGNTVQVDPDSRGAVDGLPLDQLKVFSTDDKGEIRFSLTAGSVPAGLYDTSTAVSAMTVLPDGVGPSAKATLDITKNKWLQFEGDTEIYNYGLSFGFGPGTWSYWVEFHLIARNECWNPAADLSIAAHLAIVRGSCPESVDHWPSEESPFGTLVSGSDGRLTGAGFVPVAELDETLEWTSLASRVRLSASGTNALYFYAGPPWCE